MSPCVTMGRPPAHTPHLSLCPTLWPPPPLTIIGKRLFVGYIFPYKAPHKQSRLTGRGSWGKGRGNPQAGQPPTYRHLHRLHREVAWRLQGPGPRGVPEGGECRERAEAHERVGGKRADVLADVSQLWHPKIPEQLVGLHRPVPVVPYAGFCRERKTPCSFRGGLLQVPEPARHPRAQPHSPGLLPAGDPRSVKLPLGSIYRHQPVSSFHEPHLKMFTHKEFLHEMLS